MLVYSCVTLQYHQWGNKFWLIPSHHQALFKKLSIKTLTATRHKLSSIYKNCHKILVKIQYILKCKIRRRYKCIKAKYTYFCRSNSFFFFGGTHVVCDLCGMWQFVSARCWFIFNLWILRLPILLYSEGFLIINLPVIDSFYNSGIVFCLVEKNHLILCTWYGGRSML